MNQTNTIPKPDTTPAATVENPHLELRLQPARADAISSGEVVHPPTVEPDEQIMDGSHENDDPGARAQAARELIDQHVLPAAATQIENPNQK